MVEYLSGINGIGKTRILVEAAVATAYSSKGNVIYVDCSDKLNLELPPKIRLINVKDYKINGAFELYGFLIGLCAGDYDLTDIFIDSTLEIISNNNTDIRDFMEIAATASDRTGVHFHFSVCDSSENDFVYQSVS